MTVGMGGVRVWHLRRGSSVDDGLDEAFHEECRPHLLEQSYSGKEFDHKVGK